MSKEPLCCLPQSSDRVGSEDRAQPEEEKLIQNSFLSSYFVPGGYM